MDSMDSRSAPNLTVLVTSWNVFDFQARMTQTERFTLFFWSFCCEALLTVLYRKTLLFSLLCMDLRPNHENLPNKKEVASTYIWPNNVLSSGPKGWKEGQTKKYTGHRLADGQKLQIPIQSDLLLLFQITIQMHPFISVKDEPVYSFLDVLGKKTSYQHS